VQAKSKPVTAQPTGTFNTEQAATKAILTFPSKKSRFITFKRINQPDAAISQVYYLSFKYSSTCFGHPHVHRQELQLQ
jgi:hypothetical protein